MLWHTKAQRSHELTHFRQMQKVALARLSVTNSFFVVIV